MKIDTSADKLLEVAERQFGKEVADKMQADMAGMTESQKVAYGSANAQTFIQSQAPGMNMIISQRTQQTQPAP